MRSSSWPDADASGPGPRLPLRLRAGVRFARALNRAPGPERARAIVNYRVGAGMSAVLGPDAVGVVRLPEGCMVEVPLGAPLFRDLWLDAGYEEDVAAFARARLRPGDVAVDVGANVGVLALRFGALVGPSGTVHAFEPSEIPAALLERSIARNCWEGRIEVHRVALSDAAGTGSLYVNDTAGLLSGLQRHEWLDNAEAQVVPIRRLDDVKALSVRPIRLMKIDVEGGEHDVLEGGRRLFDHNPPENVIVEVSSATDARPSVEFLMSRGFRPMETAAGGTFEVPLAPLPATSSAGPHDRGYSYRNMCFSRPGQ